MSKISLKAQERKTKEKINREKNIPAVVYGPNSENINLTLDYKELVKALAAAGESTVIDLMVNDHEPVKVLIHDTQKDPLTDRLIHVDFYQLDMHKKIKVEIELRYAGIEEVEKSTGGEVVKNLSKLEVECLPKDLVKELIINVKDYLKQIGEVLYAKDLPLTEGLALVNSPETPVISVQEIKEEIIPTTAPEATAEPEVEGEKKTAEGEEKAAPASEEKKEKKEEKK